MAVNDPFAAAPSIRDPFAAAPSIRDPFAASIANGNRGSDAMGAITAFLRGVNSNVLGTPGNIESAARAPFSLVANKLGFPLAAKTLGRNFLPTTSQIQASQFPGASIAARHPAAQAFGEVAPDAAMAVAGLGKAALDLGAARVLPGATQRAVSALSNVGKATGKFDPLGQKIISDTVGKEYAPLYDTRASELTRAAHITDETARTAAFRKIYNDPKYAQLRSFEQSPLGKKLTQTTGRYSEVTRADPAKVPDMVFDTPQSVRDFRTLMKGNQVGVEQLARQYAVESLSKAMPAQSLEVNPLASRVAKTSEAVDRWLNAPGQEWLNEVPETKRAVEQFAAGLRDTARAQKTMRLGALALGTGGLLESGFHPWGYIKSLLGGL